MSPPVDPICRDACCGGDDKSPDEIMNARESPSQADCQDECCSSGRAAQLDELTAIQESCYSASVVRSTKDEKLFNDECRDRCCTESKAVEAETAAVLSDISRCSVTNDKDVQSNCCSDTKSAPCCDGISQVFHTDFISY